VGERLKPPLITPAAAKPRDAARLSLPPDRLAGDPFTGSSFGYSSCLKWGYNGTIDVAAFNVQQAADVLGLDLTKARRRRWRQREGWELGRQQHGACSPWWLQAWGGSAASFQASVPVL
jgi:hypothetical protein